MSYNWLIHKINYDIVLNNCHLLRGRLLDLGCGTKQYYDLIAPKVNEYIGLDWTNTLHNSQPEIVADLSKELPIESDTFDSLVSFQVLEHIFEPQTMVNEAYRVLKKGGLAIFTVPFQWHIHEEPYDFARYTPFGLKYMFEKAGFTEIDIKPNSGYWVTAVMKFNYHSKRYIRGPRAVRLFIGWILSVIWFVNQRLAISLDKKDNNPRESVSYTILVTK